MIDISENDEFYNGIEIAVIGISGKYPKSKNIKELWENLKNGTYAITEFSDEELLNAGVHQSIIDDKDFVKSKGFIDRAEYFDNDFFGYSASETDLIEPQERLLYQSIWEALEDSGNLINSYDGLIGLYSGSTFNLQWPLRGIVKNEDSRLDVNQFDDKDFTSTRVSYRLNLKGPSVSIQTACSTGLTVLHIASRALILGECDIALAATSSIKLPIKGGHSYQTGSVYSKDGYLRPFDENATGIVEGDGIGVLVLKTLESAIKDKNHIYAVVKGSAINNDGKSKVGYHSPSIKGQVSVIQDAIEIAEIEKDSISFIEAHGTGTPHGDYIEATALKRIFNGLEHNSIALGSAKSNFGHTGCSSGMLGLIKSILMIKNKTLVPTINHTKPPKKLELDKSPFYIPQEKKEIIQDEIIRGCVSSFGIGGTNGHVILEEAPKIEKDNNENPINIFPLSAKSELSLNERINEIEEYFVNEDGFSDVCYTLQKGREEFEYRFAVIAETSDDVINNKPQNTFKSKVNLNTNKSIAFMFGGQGTQYSNMGLDIYKNEKTFKDVIDACFEIAERIKGEKLMNVLYPIDSTEVNDISDIEITPIITFIFEYALAKLIISKGVKADALIGHSLGEYVAACISGVFSITDAIKLVIYRGELMSNLPNGKMLSIPLPKDKINKYLSDTISLASDHGVSCTVSGKDSDIIELNNILKKERIICQLLNIDKPGHSYLIDIILESYKIKLEGITLNTPSIPIVSSVTGNFLSNDEAVDISYWVDQMRKTVQFSKGLETILENDIQTFFEINTNNALSMILHQFRSENKNIFSTVVTKFQHQKGSDLIHFYSGLAKYWCNGGTLNWDEFHNDSRYRVSLPTYSFNEKEFPIDLKSFQEKIENVGNSGRKDDIKDWFYIPSWIKYDLEKFNEVISMSKKILVFYNENTLVDEIRRKLSTLNVSIYWVFVNDEFVVENDKVGINPKKESDYIRLINFLESTNSMPDIILNFWNYENYTEEKEIEERFQISMELGYYNLINTIKAIDNSGNTKNITLIYITDKAQGNNYSAPTFPEKIISGGIVKTAQIELPKLKLKHIDIHESSDIRELSENILSLTFLDDNQEFLLDNNRVFIKKMSNIKVDNTKNIKPKDGEVYLITGGIGGIGLTLAKHLASQSNCTILLVTRRKITLSNRKEVLSAEELEMLNELETLEASINIIQCNIADGSDVKEMLREIYDKYGSIDGVIHAAGLFNGSILIENTEEKINQIFNAKVYGCIHLSKYLKTEKLSFMIYCSSLSSYLASVGQANYVAANMFLDSYAKNQLLTKGIPVTSINWDTWKEVGGAVQSVKEVNNQMGLSIVESTNLEYPTLNECIKSAVSGVYDFELNRDFWLINEHKVFDIPTLPGVVYIDWVISSFRDFINDENAILFIEELIISTPLILSENKVDIKIIFQRKSDDYSFQVISGIKSNEKDWHLHCEGLVKISTDETDDIIFDLDKVSENCVSDMTEVTLNLMKEDEVVEFGDRWISNFKRRLLGEREGLVLTEVDEKYKEEHQNFCFYPPQLDHCYGILKSGYTPFAYYNIHVYGKSVIKMWSHIKQNPTGNSNNFASYELNIADASSNKLVMKVENYLLISIAPNSIDVNNVNVVEPKKGIPLSKFIPTDIRNKDLENDVLKHGISCMEGAEIFKRIVNEPFPQILTSTRDLKRLKIMLEEEQKKFSNQEDSELVSQRPNLFVEYEAPVTKMEKELATLLQEVLSIDKVGRHDNFFDLGMTSISLIKYVSKTKKLTGMDLQLVDVFNYNTLLNLSQFILPDFSEEEIEKEEGEITNECDSKTQNISKRKKILNNEQ